MAAGLRCERVREEQAGAARRVRYTLAGEEFNKRLLHLLTFGRHIVITVPPTTR
jgi:hypothetical protein